MKILISQIGIALLLFSTTPLTVSAQEFKKMDPFFERNYAKDPLNQKPDYTKESSPEHEAETPTPGEVILGQESVDLGFTAPLEREAQLDLSVHELPLGSGRGIPVIAVSMISDNTDLPHTFDNMQNFTDLLQLLDLAAGAFYLTHFGDFPPDAPLEWIKVLARGGIITVEPRVIEEYKIQKSPSWIVRTEKGEIVLEGMTTINQFFNSKGEFLETELQKAIARTKPS